MIPILIKAVYFSNDSFFHACIFQFTMSSQSRHRDDLISTYFHLGFSYNEILEALAWHHGLIISKRTLQRVLQKLHFFRRKHKSDIVTVAVFIEHLPTEYTCLHGYRWVHAKCIQHGFVVSRDDVRLLLKILDSAGVQVRSSRKLRRRQYHSRGPNSTWHIDGYDKLKPYGLCISGCIDGFSRYIVWMSVYKTNNDPSVIAGYFVDAVREIGGMPAVVRSDMGTENGTIEVIQKAVVGDDSFRYGRSTTNQRIESWWSFFRRQLAQYWMNIFEELKDGGMFTGDFIDKNLIRFCFTNVVQVRYSYIC